MDETRRSRTIEIPAIMRALHQTLDGDPKILLDPIAPRLIDADERRAWLTPLLAHPFAKQWRAGFALRARYVEDALAEAVQSGVGQYLILGAGLDTFAYRQPTWASGLRVYDLDHPVSQQWKKDRLKASGIPIPSNSQFVPIDFERMSIAEGLNGSGFFFEMTALCSWMGVTQYLTADALDATLRFVLSLPAASEIIFSFILPQETVSGVEAEALALAAQRSAEVGEPWLTRFHPEELATKLGAMGFSRIVHLTPEDARRCYFDNRTDGLAERHGEQLMRAMV